jgi:glycerol-3-phosphate dehydrogenase (NAD(P)+)
MRRNRENRRYLPGIRLPDSLTVIDHLQQLPPTCTLGVLATPCQTTREMVGRLQVSVPQLTSVVCTAKGLELGSERLVHQVVAEAYGKQVNVAILSGPTFAREVAEGKPAAVTIAATDDPFSRALVARFHTPRFRPYLTDDLLGVALGGSVKNVLAIAAGIADGLGLGANSRAALITRGLAELARLGVAMGARKDTFMGLSGLGDLVLTCTDDQSRNRRFGLALGRGAPVAQAQQEVGLVEGVATARALESMASRLQVDTPIAQAVAGIVRGEVTPAATVAALMSREPATETDSA